MGNEKLEVDNDIYVHLSLSHLFTAMTEGQVTYNFTLRLLIVILRGPLNGVD